MRPRKGAAAQGIGQSGRYRPPERVHHHHASLFQHEHHPWVSAARSRDRHPSTQPCRRRKRSAEQGPLRQTNDDYFISSVFPRRQKKEEKLDCVTDRRLLCDKRKGTGSPCSARWPSLKRWRPKSRLPRALQAVAQRSVTSRASPISVVEALSH